MQFLNSISPVFYLIKTMILNLGKYNFGQTVVEIEYLINYDRLGLVIRMKIEPFEIEFMSEINSYKSWTFV